MSYIFAVSKINWVMPYTASFLKVITDKNRRPGFCCISRNQQKNRGYVAWDTPATLAGSCCAASEGWSCDCRAVPFAWVEHGCVTSEQRDPLPVMRRVQPHRTTTLLTCLNNSLGSVYHWLAGCSHLEDSMSRRLGVARQTGEEEVMGGPR